MGDHPLVQGFLAFHQQRRAIRRVRRRRPAREERKRRQYGDEDSFHGILLSG